MHQGSQEQLHGELLAQGSEGRSEVCACVCAGVGGWRGGCYNKASTCSNTQIKAVRNNCRVNSLLKGGNGEVKSVCVCVCVCGGVLL